MLKKVSGYLIDKEFRLTLYTYKLHIVNYKEIISLSDDEVIIKTNNGKVLIYGENLTLIKLVEDEVLLSGKIKRIEVNFND